MVGNHGFVDGNKRTAWLLAEILVDRSGYRLNVPVDDPIDDLVVAVATGEMDFDQLIGWFKERVERR